MAYMDPKDIWNGKLKNVWNHQPDYLMIYRHRWIMDDGGKPLFINQVGPVEHLWQLAAMIDDSNETLRPSAKLPSR